MDGGLLLGAVAANQERIIICIQINNTVDGVVVATTRNAKTTSTSANSTDDGENTWLNGILDEVAPLRCTMDVGIGTCSAPQYARQGVYSQSSAKPPRPRLVAQPRKLDELKSIVVRSCSMANIERNRQLKCFGNHTQASRISADAV